MSPLNDMVMTRAFLLVVGAYDEKVASMRQIMDCMQFYLAKGTENIDAPATVIPDATFPEYAMAHDVIVAAQSNALLLEMISSLLTARGRSDTDIKIACRWFSSNFSLKVLNMEDTEGYRQEWVKWEGNEGPRFVDEDTESRFSNEEEEAELGIGSVTPHDQEPTQAQALHSPNPATHSVSSQAPAIPPNSPEGSSSVARQWKLSDYVPSPPTFPNVNQRKKCSKQCTKSRKNQLTIQDFRLKVAGTTQLYSECNQCLDRTWDKKGGWKPAEFR